MIALYREDREVFDARYHGRSKAESVWSALKRAQGNPLSSRRWRARTRELYLRTIAYNVGVVNRLSVEAEGKQRDLPSKAEETSKAKPILRLKTSPTRFLNKSE